MAITIGQLATVTREHYRPKLVDQVFKDNVVFSRMKKQNRLQIRGGRVIRQPISYAATTAVMAYEGAEILATNPNDQLTQAEYEWRQYSGTASFVNKDLALNDSEEELLDYMETKLDLLRKSLSDTLGTDLQSTGGSKKLDGLGKILQGTGTYAGIASSDISDWKAQNRTLGTAGTLTLFEIQKQFGLVTDGTDKPTLAITRQSVFDRVWALLQADQRFAPTKDGSAGFETLHVSGVPIMVDSHVDGTDGGNQDNHFRVLNEKYLKMVIHPAYNFEVVPIPPLKDQDVKMIRILFMGNIVCTKLRVQGEITTIDPDLG
jgi:hypothetical protein